MIYSRSVRLGVYGAVLLGVCLAAGPAEGVGGYMLVSREGERSTSAGRAEAEIPMGQVFAMAPPVQYENGAHLVASVVTQAEGVARRSPAADATNVQRENLWAEKAQVMRQIAASVVGHNASFGIEVVDVVNRPTSADEGAWGRQATVMVIGRVDWVSPMVPSVAYRREAAEVTGEAERQMKELRSAGAREGSTTSAEQREIQEGMKKQLAELRARYEGRRPGHYVYLVGANEAFGAWRRGQRRACRGIVQRAGLFTYVEPGPVEALRVEAEGRVKQEDTASAAGVQGEDFSEAYVGLELVVRAIPEVKAGK